jgi:hypothetical protein
VQKVATKGYGGSHLLVASNSPAATAMAVPVQRSGRSLVLCGQQSLVKSSRMEVNWNSHSEIGLRGLKRAKEGYNGYKGWYKA